MWTDFGQYHTRADPESWYLSIRHVNGIGQGCGEGAQSRSAYDPYLWLSEVPRDALGEVLETSSEGHLSVGHGLDIGRPAVIRARFFNRAHTPGLSFPLYLSLSSSDS